MLRGREARGGDLPQALITQGERCAGVKRCGAWRENPPPDTLAMPERENIMRLYAHERSE